MSLQICLSVTKVHSEFRFIYISIAAHLITCDHRVEWYPLRPFSFQPLHSLNELLYMDVKWYLLELYRLLCFVKVRNNFRRSWISAPFHHHFSNTTLDIVDRKMTEHWWTWKLWRAFKWFEINITSMSQRRAES